MVVTRAFIVSHQTSARKIITQQHVTKALIEAGVLPYGPARPTDIHTYFSPDEKQGWFVAKGDEAKMIRDVSQVLVAHELTVVIQDSPNTIAQLMNDANWSGQSPETPVVDGALASVVSELKALRARRKLKQISLKPSRSNWHIYLTAAALSAALLFALTKWLT